MERWTAPLVFCCFLMLAGCGELPAEGPQMTAVQVRQQEANTAGFLLIDVNARVANYLRAAPTSNFSEKFGRGRPFRSGRIGVGDILSVQVWEADPGGLFSSTGAVNRGLIQNLAVDSAGYIVIPFAGNVRARGRTPRQLGAVIAKKLEGKTVEPQVHVAITRNVANTVTITGHVRRPAIVAMTNKGDSLLDVIAQAGGTVAPAYESVVSITRSGKVAKAYFSHVLNSPKDNIYLRRGDEIHVERKPQSYSAFGAVIKKGKIDFGAAKLSLLEAIGKVSGLADLRADARGVFVMRFEPRKTVYDLAQSKREDPRRIVPVIYRLDLKDPSQYFFAQSIPLKNKDIIYVANAPAVEVDKFLTILGKALAISKDALIISKL